MNMAATDLATSENAICFHLLFFILSVFGAAKSRWPGLSHDFARREVATHPTPAIMQLKINPRAAPQIPSLMPGPFHNPLASSKKLIIRGGEGSRRAQTLSPNSCAPEASRKKSGSIPPRIGLIQRRSGYTWFSYDCSCLRKLQGARTALLSDLGGPSPGHLARSQSDTGEA